ncbi:hypothetical protein ACHAWF_011626 [Thalassiosira exigua]
MIHRVLIAIAVASAWPDRRGAEAFAPVGPSLTSSRASTFTSPKLSPSSSSRASRLSSSRATFADASTVDVAPFDPLGRGGGWDDPPPVAHRAVGAGAAVRNPSTCARADESDSRGATASAVAPALAFSALILRPASALAASAPLSQGDFNPDSFRPVCAASDSFYRLLQGTTRAVVGDEKFTEYGPLIAGGLLRVRLELCVVESFFNEAVGPFVRENGLSWILPWHETVETFLAGTIFALATTFILLGSTKLIQIIAFYGDLLVGGPCRLFGGFFFDRARGEPVTLDVSLFGFFKTRLVGPPVDFKEEEAKGEGREGKPIDFDKVTPADVPLLALSGGVKVVGDASKVFREFIEALDLFVGRYLVLIASGYIGLKFVHFKIFPDFP